MRTFVRWLRSTPPYVRWPLVVLVWAVVFWPQIVTAALGHPVSLNAFVIGAIFSTPLFRRIESDGIKARTGWDAAEAKERVALARRGVLPETQRERSRLRYLLDRELSQSRGLAWFVPIVAPLAIAWVVYVGLAEDLPAFAVAAGLWYAALAVAVLRPTLTVARTEKAEIRHALHLLGDT